MILLKDLFKTLATGVYANTTFGDTGVIKVTHYDKVVSLINLGVLELYKRFNFLTNELTLHVTPTNNRYYLRPDRVAALANISGSLYIEESPGTDGFLNIIKITGAYDATGAELRINKISGIPSIVEVAPDILHVSNITFTQVINIVYQSYPNKIVITNSMDPYTYQLHIPDIVIDPLISYIAAKTFKPMGANDSTANADKSANYEQQYELACKKLEVYGLAVSDRTEKDSFESNGWV